jgi:hypothetical protein
VFAKLFEAITSAPLPGNFAKTIAKNIDIPVTHAYLRAPLTMNFIESHLSDPGPHAEHIREIIYIYSVFVTFHQDDVRKVFKVFEPMTRLADNFSASLRCQQCVNAAETGEKLTITSLQFTHTLA